MSTIKACVSKNTTGNEVFVFKFENPISVPLTEENGVSQLKLVFRELLALLAAGEDVEVQFEDDEKHSSNLFSQACEAYVAELNTELMQVKEDMDREGLIKVSFASAEE